MYRIVLDPSLMHDFEWVPSFTARLLWQHLKFDKGDNFDNFLQDVRMCSELSMERLVDFICGDEPPASRLIVVNLDEVNLLLAVGERGAFHLGKVLRLMRSCTQRGLCFFAVVLTSTAVLKMRDVLEISETNWHEFQLPPLGVRHMSEVVVDVAMRCRKDAKNDLDWASERFAIEWFDGDNPVDHMQSSHPLFLQLLKLLGGNCRFLEFAVFRMGFCPRRSQFRPLLFLSALHRLSDSRFISSICKQTASDIGDRYRGYQKSWNAVAGLLPQLIAITLFDIPLVRSTRFEDSTRKATLSVEDLEQMGIIVIDSTNRQLFSPSVPLCIPSSFPATLTPRETGHVSIRDPSDSRDWELVLLRIPLIWLQHFFAQTMAADSLRDLPLLTSHSNFLSPDGNERLTLTIVMLKMFYYVKFPQLWPECVRRVDFESTASASASSSSSSNSFCLIPLSLLFPLRLRQTDAIIRLELQGLNDLRYPYWKVEEALHQLDRRSFPAWHSKQATTAENPHFIMNKARATFADSIITTTPVLLMQDKQQVTHRRDLVKNDARNLGEDPADFKVQEAEEDERPRGAKRKKSALLQSVQEEHERSTVEVSHIFIYTTDLPLSAEDQAKLKDNEVVIHKGNSQQFYGRLLSHLKAYCVDVREGVATTVEGATVPTLEK